MLPVYCSLTYLILSFSFGHCENCYKEENISKGFVTSLIKFLDYAFDYVFQAFFGLDSNAPDDEEKSSQKISYNGFQLLKLWPRTDDDVNNIKIIGQQASVQFWLPVIKNTSTDIVIPPNAIADFKEELKEYGIEYAVLNSNIEEIIANQRTDIPINSNETQKLKQNNKGSRFAWTHYPTYDEILDYMDYLQIKFPDIVKIITIGKSYEGKELKLIKITSGRFSDGSVKPATWIDGGMHAREWISVVVALFIAKELIENYKSNRSLVTDMDWYILPVANPDGYVYSHTTDRLWKKSRSLNSELMNKFFWKEEEQCKGVDLSLNWDFQWNEDSPSFSNPCLDTYSGASPFSEPETKAMSNFLKQHQRDIVVYLTLHAYSQTWLMPRSPISSMKSQEYADLIYMARKAIEVLKKSHGTNYDLLTRSESNYAPRDSFSDEWVKNKLGIKYSYTIELRDKGTYGFLLPPDQILSTAREIYTAIKMLTKSILNNAVNKNVKY